MTLSTSYGMVKETLRWLQLTCGIEIVVVDIIFPVESPVQITEAVSAAMAAHHPVSLCIFSHISSMVCIAALQGVI